MFGSVSATAMRSALDALALRQRVIADNVANVSTPGFRAGRATFEDELTRAVAQGTGDVIARVTRSTDPARLDGNNVDLAAETLLNVETNLRYQLAVRAVDGGFASVRAAMRTS